MRIEHIAIWTNELERLRDFYVNYFHGSASERYDNPKKQFSSYFISFSSGCRLEIMKRTDIHEYVSKEMIGLAHFAIEVGSKEDVDHQTTIFEEDGYAIEYYPRTTGDGYYESVILDPDQNRVELVAKNNSV